MPPNEPGNCADDLMGSARLCFVLSFAQTVCSFAMVGHRALTVAISCAEVAAAIMFTSAWTRRPERKDHAPDAQPATTKSLRRA
jgi:hypothetical protein